MIVLWFLVNQLISRKRIRSPEHEDEPVAKRRKRYALIYENNNCYIFILH